MDLTLPGTVLRLFLPTPARAEADFFSKKHCVAVIGALTGRSIPYQRQTWRPSSSIYAAALWHNSAAAFPLYGLKNFRL
jgi:hypothetical protein